MNFFTLLAPFYDCFMAPLHKQQGRLLLDRLAPLDSRKVLDLGGGTGRLAALLAKAGADVWLLDSSAAMLKRARRVMPEKRALLGDAAALPFAENSFDVVMIVDALHHFRKQETVLKEVLRVLMPGGTLAVLDFDRKSAAVKVLTKIEQLVSEPALMLTARQLENLLAQNGFVKLETEQISAHQYLITGSKPLPSPIARGRKSDVGFV
ncbi:MAG: methyltransferase domain-containing protein [Dethiobacter sp.]|nr:methyltransferase domain-containing protein [Dethiobacter sp.]MBS3898738.1 methyltransferase domain-containing protein [Dethiobacter sp.]MBS3983572.1 methyltransferase domain-containing protein [Dethiobacter sp.]MCL4462592.1 methyltransferase domain-containing protein [Bacillota bacterium]